MDRSLADYAREAKSQAAPLGEPAQTPQATHKGSPREMELLRVAAQAESPKAGAVVSTFQAPQA